MRQNAALIHLCFDAGSESAQRRGSILQVVKELLIGADLVKPVHTDRLGTSLPHGDPWQCGRVFARPGIRVRLGLSLPEALIAVRVRSRLARCYVRETKASIVFEHLWGCAPGRGIGSHRLAPTRTLGPPRLVGRQGCEDGCQSVVSLISPLQLQASRSRIGCPFGTTYAAPACECVCQWCLSFRCLQGALGPKVARQGQLEVISSRTPLPELAEIHRHPRG